MKLRWKVFYGDGSTFSSADGEAQDAPPLDVQAIAQMDPEVGRHVILGPRFGKDYYYYEDGEWYAADIFGLFDYLMRSGLVKFGRTISNKDFNSIVKRATDDPDFSPKAPDDTHNPEP